MSGDPDLEPWVLPVAQPFPLDTEIVGTNKTFGDYLAWSSSEVLDSQRRGFVAEFMVMEALGEDLRYISGDMYDLRYRGGIQVKASSAVQRWGGPNVHRIGFSTKAKQAYTTDSDGRAVTLPAQRRGKCWVLAVHVPRAQDAETARRDVLDATTWRYWVTDPRAIRYEHRAPGLPPSTPGYVSLLTVIANAGAGIMREHLKAAVDGVMDAHQASEPPAWHRVARLEDWILEEQLHLVPADAIEAVRSTIDELQTVGHPVRVDFSPGVVRLKRGGARRVAISLERLDDLAAGKARLLQWHDNGIRRTWDHGEAVGFAFLPDAVASALG